MTTINTAYNLYLPSVHKCFVITGILMGGDRNIGASGDITEIYQADSATNLTASRDILKVEILKNGHRDIAPMNILVDEGAYVNAKYDDNNVFI